MELAARQHVNFLSPGVFNERLLSTLADFVKGFRQTVDSHLKVSSKILLPRNTLRSLLERCPTPSRVSHLFSPSRTGPLTGLDSVDL